MTVHFVTVVDYNIFLNHRYICTVFQRFLKQVHVSNVYGKN